MSSPSLSTLIKINDLLSGIKDLETKLAELESSLTDLKLDHARSLDDEINRLKSSLIQSQNLKKLESDLESIRNREIEIYQTCSNQIDEKLNAYTKSESYTKLIKTLFNEWLNSTGAEPEVKAGSDLVKYLPDEVKKIAKDGTPGQLTFENQFKIVELDPTSLKNSIFKDLLVSVINQSQ